MKKSEPLANARDSGLVLQSKKKREENKKEFHICNKHLC